MLDNDHEAFSPPSGDPTLWRYTNFTKLLSLLEGRELYFPRSDKFLDPFEGAISMASVEVMRKKAIRENGPTEAVDLVLKAAEAVRLSMYISCWFASEHESAAMWSLYCDTNEGVAIRTSHSALVREIESSPLRIRTSMVRYVDYDRTIIPIGNLFYPYVHKRLSFAHENELRAIVWSQEDVNKSQVADGAPGIAVAVDPARLIEAVHVAPNAPPWFAALVGKVLSRYSLTCPIIKSGLYERPTY